MKDIETKNFCRNVVYIREKTGLSRKQMAELMGIGMTTFNKIEKGVITNRVTVLVLYALLDNFGVTAGTLLSEDTEQIDRQMCYNDKT